MMLSICLRKNLSWNIDFLWQEPAGDILVFLTGQDDIEAAVRLLMEDGQALESRSSGILWCLYVHFI